MDITIFSRYNRKDIQDRQIDTLIGISKGLIADGRIERIEVDFLQGWLIQAQNTLQSPIIVNLLQKIDSMLCDDQFDDFEALELLNTLRAISGEKSEIGEIAKTSTMPVNRPMPTMMFTGKTFLFTGTCAFGTRKQCRTAIEELRGINAKSVTKNVDYLILGTYVTDGWAHESYGRKIERAMKYRERGLPLAIVTEAHWISEARI